jgi:hypothetical protein
MVASLVSGASGCGQIDPQDVGQTDNALEAKPHALGWHHTHESGPEGETDHPNRGWDPAFAATSATQGFGITYNGGPVMHGTINVYYIWYGNWSGNSAVQILTDLANNIGGSPYFNINTTYGDTTGAYVSNSVHYAGSETDNYSQGTRLSDAQIALIVNSHIGAGHLPVDPNGVYFVLTSSDVNESSGFCTQYCGWHTDDTLAGADIKYAFIGNPARCPSACEEQTTSPNGNAGADGMASIISHELEESATDPDLNAWVDSSGAENADKCAWTFGATYTVANGSEANMRLGSRDFLIQQNWLNTSPSGGCALSYNASPDFSVTTSPPSQSVVQGGATSYAVSVTAANGYTGTVSLSVSGAPAGATAGFDQTSVAAGGGTNLTVSTVATVTPGSYPLTVTASDGTLTHTSLVTLVVTPPPDFTVAVSPASGTVGVGSSTTFTVTVTAQNGFAAATTLAVSGLGAGATAGFNPSSLPGAGTSTLTVTAAANAATGTFPLTITATSGSLVHTASASLVVAVIADPVVNGTFETGTLSGWTTSGVTAVSSHAHGGSWAAQLGSANPSQNSNLIQTFKVPATGGTLSFWYLNVCGDRVTRDWATATLRDTSGNITTTILQKTCTNTGTWVQVTRTLTAGHTYTLTLTNHDDNRRGLATYTLFDDVHVQ